MAGDIVWMTWIFALAAAVLWLASSIVEGRRRQDRLRLFAEFHGRILERMTSAAEFAEFFNTTGGARFLDSLSIESGGAQVRIVRAVQGGVVLLILGLSLFIAGGGMPDESPYKIICTIITAVGGGLLVSAAASFVVSKRLGLLERPGDRFRNDPPPRA